MFSYPGVLRAQSLHRALREDRPIREKFRVP